MQDMGTVDRDHTQAFQRGWEMEAGWRLRSQALLTQHSCTAILNISHILSKSSIEKGPGPTHRADLVPPGSCPMYPETEAGILECLWHGSEASSNNGFFTAIWGYLQGMVVQKMQRQPHRAPAVSHTHTHTFAHECAYTHTCAYVYICHACGSAIPYQHSRISYQVPPHTTCVLMA